VAIFDAYLDRVAACRQALARAGRSVREFDGRGDPERLRHGLPVRLGPGAASGVVLREDAWVELGSPETASCAFSLWSDAPSRLRAGRITLIGPGIADSPGASLPFGQVLMAAGRELTADTACTREPSVSDQIEGYMARSRSGRLWSRVSKQVAERGFDFDTLGKALIAHYREQIPEIQAMEVLFVTSGADDVRRLASIAEQVATIRRNITKQTWQARGYDGLECTLGVDCRVCSDKATCDGIRELVKIQRRKVRVAAGSEGGGRRGSPAACA
jgi:CO dehydrogenase/acetyl-CoA synthase beta subunit